MPVSGVSESVQVSAESPIIDVKQNAAAVSIDAELIDRMPKGRDFLSVITTAPGTTAELKAGGLQVDGASGSENRFVVDGLDTTSLRTGVNQKNVLVDFVQEVQVKSSGYNAEYRATTGGVVSAITKSGSNSIRGDVNVYYDNDKWLGAVRPTLRLVPTDNSKAEYIATPRNDAYQADMALDVGGPILRDKAWFFVGYAPQTHSESRTVTFTSNSQKGTFDADTDAFDLNYNVTSQVMKNLRVKVAASNQRANGLNRTLPGIEANGTSTSNPALFPNPFEQPDHQRLLRRRHRVGGDAEVLRQRATWAPWATTPSRRPTRSSRPRWCTRFSPAQHLHAVVLPVPGDPVEPAAAERLQRQSLEHPQLPGQVRPRSASTPTRPTTATSGGSTPSRAVVQWERLSNDVLTRRRGTRRCRWCGIRRARPWTIRHASCAASYGYYTVVRRYTEGAIHSNNVGLFMQDSWTLNNRLTLNLGLRGRRTRTCRRTARRIRASPSASPTSSRRASASPTTSRVTASGRPTAAGAVLRHHEARDAARRRAAPITGSTTTTRSTASTGRPSTAAAEPAAAVRARSSSRPTAGTSRTIREQTWPGSIRTSSRCRRRS